jgi:hypothetical protein
MRQTSSEMAEPAMTNLVPLPVRPSGCERAAFGGKNFYRQFTFPNQIELIRRFTFTENI